VFILIKENMETHLGSKIWSEQLIREVIEVVRPVNTPEVYSISFRNKVKSFCHGNYGKFYTEAYRITLCVPEHHLFPIEGNKKVTKTPFHLKDDIEYLVTVMAHEYWHAYQWINLNHLYKGEKYWLERGAEEREAIALARWNDYLQLKGEKK